MKKLEDIIKKNYENIQENIYKACQKVGRDFKEIKILGASKKQDSKKIKICFDLGIKIFGENYVQEAEKKIKELSDLAIQWHLIGKLQTNKVKKALNLFHLIESLDRLELAQKIQKYAEKMNKIIPVFIEINIGKEPTKAGIFPEQIEDFLEKIKNLNRIEIRGLMCLPPYKDNLEEVRPYFVKMRKIFEKIKPYMGQNFKELSMGTSNDYIIAVEEGATIVRIGEALFGKRSCNY